VLWIINYIICQVPEKKIPDAILRQAKGLAIITVVKVGMMVTYNIGTGLVVARREDGSWSPPSAISTFGAGWGAQVSKFISDNFHVYCLHLFQVL
jgi:lipid-binding SYLF domain-containing protein